MSNTRRYPCCFCSRSCNVSITYDNYNNYKQCRLVSTCIALCVFFLLLMNIVKYMYVCLSNYEHVLFMILK